MNDAQVNAPQDRIAGLKENWRYDVVSGAIVFLIALPLCLGIALASGVPPIAGIISAIVGGIIVSQISGSYVTINGPAAGLIVVILGTVDRFGGGQAGYHAALAAIVVSGLILFFLGLIRSGELGFFFPAAAVEGMLAAIGIIIIAKQLPVMFGFSHPAKEPLILLLKIPEMLLGANPEVAIIGITSLVVLIVHARLKNKLVKLIPAPLIVVIIAVVIGSWFDFSHAHTYQFAGNTFTINPQKHLVALPKNFFHGLTYPDFSHILSTAFWLSVLSITLVQGIESLLSAAAVDKLDPFARQSNLSRDLAAIGLGSSLSGMIGGLPMIAEIVRSSANVASGARTRWSNFIHGILMAAFSILGVSLINRIPLASLAALLVFTGYRLASPHVFRDIYKIGKKQFIVFMVTIITTLSTDLLIGVSIGILTKLLIHLLSGAKLNHLFKAQIENSQEIDGTISIKIIGSALFSNYLSAKRYLDKIPVGKNIIVDLGQAHLIDHSFLEKLHYFAANYNKSGGNLTVVNFKHPVSASQSSSHTNQTRTVGPDKPC